MPTVPSPPTDGILHRYWVAYGGLSSVIRSPSPYIAAALTVLAMPFWWLDQWWEPALTVLPNLLGFSVGGFVMWLGFGDAPLRRALHKNRHGGGASLYLSVSSVFAHFVLMQSIALVIAVVSKASHTYPIWQFPLLEKVLALVYVDQALIVEVLAPVGHFFGYFFFMYSLACVVEATLAIFRIASWHDVTQRMPRCGRRYPRI